MNVKELKEKLAAYPDDTEVFVGEILPDADVRFSETVTIGHFGDHPVILRETEND